MFTIAASNFTTDVKLCEKVCALGGRADLGRAGLGPGRAHDLWEDRILETELPRPEKIDELKRSHRFEKHRPIFLCWLQRT